MDGTEEGLMDDIVDQLESIVTANHGRDGSIVNTHTMNGGSPPTPDKAHYQLTQMVMELSFQNEYLKSQIADLKSERAKLKDGSKHDGEVSRIEEGSELAKTLHKQIINLNKEFEEQREKEKAAEDAIDHLRAACSEADRKVLELSAKLVEAQQKMEQEVKERDDKYVELDTKFGRLHKRAKQRIQESQKEKDDLEAHFNDVNAKLEQASSEHALAQQELERAYQQAKKALQSMEAEKQQLRTTNNKLQGNIDEIRHSLEAKEHAFEELQQSFLEKEQMLEQIQGTLQSMEEKRQASIIDLTAKHQKRLESLEGQFADTETERSKAAETIYSSQMLLAKKDSEIAELNAASTGEAVRLGAALEDMRGEIKHLKDQHEEEIKTWEATYQALRVKVEASENATLQSETASDKLRSQLELEISMLNRSLQIRDAELAAVKDEINLLEKEFSAYKVRAFALLQKKDAELSAAKKSELVKAQDEALKEAEREVADALAERDKAIQDLENALTKHEKEIAARDAALTEAERHIRSISVKLNSATTQYLSEKELWRKDLEYAEESWKLKYNASAAQNICHTGDDVHKDFGELKIQFEKLKEERDSFRDIADRMIEEKEKEIAKLVEENNKLHRSLKSPASADHQDRRNSAFVKHDAQTLTIVAAEQQILLLAKQQAQREEELARTQRHILALHEEIEELERENQLHNQQEETLKAELRNMERSQKREGIDMTYLKNVIIKLLETGEVEALLPVVATLLQFSPEEIRKCQKASRFSRG